MNQASEGKMAITTRTSREQSNDGPNDRSLNDEQLSPSFLEKLPAELIHEIASYLSAPDLGCLGATCRALVDHASNDLLWASLVNERLPTPIQNSGPFESFRRLYLAYHPYWFIPQHKIWFADTEHTGMLIIARYDNRRGVIEAYPVFADRGFPQFQTWISHPEVMIQSFEPSVYKGFDPVLFLSDHNPSSRTAPIQSFKSMPERHMPMYSDTRHMYTSLSLCSSFKHSESRVKPYVLWPPRTIQTNARTVRDLRDSSPPIPKYLSDLSESFFRVRKWANQELTSPAPNEPGLTFSTLDPVLYTPTEAKPYQGIWVGDYSAHGCEFLLVSQDKITTVAPGSENESKIIDAQEDVRHRGPLLAVKLTGDPNVPRGQYSFVADDIGASGFISIGTEEPFVGARIVRCRGHVAGLGFHDDTYIESQLILISPDHMAHYWKEMGHVSYYRRVDIDAL
ncbi:hypothetical protein DTO013E5_7302 [Penicillium roqueforti]|uniref:F-box domain, cyclin-like n=1 Tax=Penicillium roqueforti (strain FM164) TaxID=1365484 RepID=W6QGW8_PENRF|nr:uncharacterized protein LCP9604111_3062 [Penicillium roqueforti]CDM33434.1 F-box domain, cyclin-like [Penicillium roqueforti FM164]KAF9250858.1 hypothetical protein LCP9604111_3062 [Penicillium roqueforti]KAI1830924.1 hypothetical protein CBS147337_8281 [Penicillium roqueforti]KAI2681479.1 hypothetical protein CBS147355_2689 [Penicillium roqueforti]KAI2688867.1 hypothetical protein LCP963914a_1956 [Penicillium roqueforti]